MTFTITKLRLGIAILVVAVLAPATALAVHSWPDVDDGRFYAEAVAWAKANGMTTGCNGGAAFCPEDPVTRGENITFAKRYDDLVVQPALSTLTTDVAANAADIAALPALSPVGFATVLADGSVVAARSRGVTSANVSLDSISAFCFQNLGFDFTSVQVAPLYVGDQLVTTTEIGYPDTTGFGLSADCDDAEAVLEIATLLSGTWTPRGFTVVFFA